MIGLDGDEVFERSKVRQALKTIYDKNVVTFADGELGAVNGFRADLVSLRH